MPPVQVTDDVAYVIQRRHDLDLHHRLKYARSGLGQRFAEAGTRCALERPLVRVHVVIATVDQRAFEIDDQEVGHDPGLLCGCQTFLDSGNERLRDRTAAHRILERESAAWFAGLEADL